MLSVVAFQISIVADHVLTKCSRFHQLTICHLDCVSREYNKRLYIRNELVLLGGTASYWLLCLCRNDFVFEKVSSGDYLLVALASKIYLVFEKKHSFFSYADLHSVIHWFHSWAILHRHTF